MTSAADAADCDNVAAKKRKIDASNRNYIAAGMCFLLLCGNYRSVLFQLFCLTTMSLLLIMNNINFYLRQL